MTQALAPTRPLSDLIAEINHRHQAVATAFRAGLDEAIACGRLLYQAKDQLPHGKWLPWLQQHFHGDPRTAQRYMTASTKYDTLSYLDLPRTLHELTTPNPPPKPDTTTPMGRLAAAVDHKPQPDYIDTTAIEDDEPTTQLPRPYAQDWTAALTAEREIRALIIEAGGPLNPHSAAQALREAAIHARRLTARLANLAAALDKCPT